MVWDETTSSHKTGLVTESKGAQDVEKENLLHKRRN
jgi:hypothetical protein